MQGSSRASSVAPSCCSTSHYSGHSSNKRNMEDLKAGAITPFHLKSCRLYMNSILVDKRSEAEMMSTPQGCNAEYARFNSIMNVAGNAQSIGIDMETYSSIQYISAYDLTTNRSSNEPGIAPSVMAGALSLEVTFSAPPPINITMIGVAEYAECLKVIYFCFGLLYNYIKLGLCCFHRK